jgi:antitoxin VapB
VLLPLWAALQLERDLTTMDIDQPADGPNTAAAIEAGPAERLDETGPASDPTLVEDLLAIARHCQALPVLDDRSEDEILGYDENGLPC